MSVSLITVNCKIALRRIFEDQIQGFSLVFSGAEIQSHTQWNLGDLFPNFEKNTPNLHFFFWKIGIFIQ